MKDRSAEKSGLISSVIVSLLAGFIYYQFGNDIQVTLDRSFKAVLSYSDSEVFGPFNSQSLFSQIKNSDKKHQKNLKSGFYFKKQSKIDDIDVSDYSYLENKSQAKIQIAVPDRNIDFTSELNNLIKKNQQPVVPELNRNKNTEKELSENGGNYFYGIPIDKNEIFNYDESSVEYVPELEFNFSTDEGISKDIDQSKISVRINIINEDDRNKLKLKCKTESKKIIKKELNNTEINFRIYINDKEEEDIAPEIFIENENTEEDQL